MTVITCLENHHHYPSLSQAYYCDVMRTVVTSQEVTGAHATWHVYVVRRVEVSYLVCKVQA